MLKEKDKFDWEYFRERTIEGAAIIMVFSTVVVFFAGVAFITEAVFRLK